KMKKNSCNRFAPVHHNLNQPGPVHRSFSEGGFFNFRALIGFTLCFVGAGLALFAHFSPLSDHVSLSSARNASHPPLYLPVPGADSREEAEGLGRLEQFWNDRLTYPTGRFDPRWVRAAAAQHARLRMGVPAGLPALFKGLSPLALSTTNFTALGPQPERMTGC